MSSPAYKWDVFYKTLAGWCTKEKFSHKLLGDQKDIQEVLICPWMKDFPFKLSEQRHCIFNIEEVKEKPRGSLMIYTLWVCSALANSIYSKSKERKPKFNFTHLWAFYMNQTQYKMCIIAKRIYFILFVEYLCSRGLFVHSDVAKSYSKNWI